MTRTNRVCLSIDGASVDVSLDESERAFLDAKAHALGMSLSHLVQAAAFCAVLGQHPTISALQAGMPYATWLREVALGSTGYSPLVKHIVAARAAFKEG